jgi:hypothetical protein
MDYRERLKSNIRDFKITRVIGGERFEVTSIHHIQAVARIERDIDRYDRHFPQKSPTG